MDGHGNAFIYMFGTIEIPFGYIRCNEAQTFQKPKYEAI